MLLVNLIIRDLSNLEKIKIEIEKTGLNLNVNIYHQVQEENKPKDVLMLRS